MLKEERGGTTHARARNDATTTISFTLQRRRRANEFITSYMREKEEENVEGARHDDATTT